MESTDPRVGRRRKQSREISGMGYKNKTETHIYFSLVDTGHFTVTAQRDGMRELGWGQDNEEFCDLSC